MEMNKEKATTEALREEARRQVEMAVLELLLHYKFPVKEAGAIISLLRLAESLPGMSREELEKLLAYEKHN